MEYSNTTTYYHKELYLAPVLRIAIWVREKDGQFAPSAKN